MRRVTGSRESPVGLLIATASDDALCALSFSDEKTSEHRDSNAILEDLWRQLDEYFRGERRDFALPLAYPGTKFQEQVWSALREIRYGETWSYLDLARRVGDTGATRAVGAANGANPIAIVIPCHRVINADGELGGYGGGLWRKRILLDLERGQGRLPF